MSVPISENARMRLIFSLLLILLCWLQYQLWLGKGSQHQLRELQEAIDKQEMENAELLERNAALQAEVENLRSGVEAIEEFARSEMGMIKEDETFYLIVDPKKKAAMPVLPTPDSNAKPKEE